MRFCALPKVYLEQSTITELISHPIVPRAGPSADNPARRVADPRFSSRLLLLVRDPPPAQTRGNTPCPTREYGANEPLATATGLVVEAELVGAAGMEETVVMTVGEFAQVKERAAGALALAAGSAGRVGFRVGRTERRHGVGAARVGGGDGAPHGQNQWHKQDLVDDHGRDEPIVYEGERALGDGIGPPDGSTQAGVAESPQQAGHG